METVDVNNMGIIDGSGVFNAQVIGGSQPIIYAQDAAHTNSNDLTMYGNKVILMQIVQENQTPTSVNSYVLNSQIPVVSQQLFLSQDNFLTQSVENVDESKLITFNSSSLTVDLHQEHLDVDGKDIEENEEIDNQFSTSNDDNNVRSKGEINKGAPHAVEEKFCVTCGLYFDNEKLFRKHNRTHLFEKPFKCHLCEESFNFEVNLSLHLATHSVDNPFCPICKKRFNRAAGLKAHIMVHEKEESLFCPECGDEFTSQMFLDEHLEDHKTESLNVPIKKKQYNCLQCQAKFAKSRSLKEHCKILHRLIPKKKMKRRRKNSYICSYCQKAFSKPSQLSRHCRIHTGERPFQCELCPRAFNQKGSLQIHMLKHTGIKPYECKFCHASFTQKGNLQAHVIKLHTISVADGRIHTCPHCTCIFGKARSLRAHMTKVHGIFGRDEIEITKVPVTICSDVQLNDTSNKENESKTTEGGEPRLMLNANLEENRNEQKQDSNNVRLYKWHQCTYCSKEFKRPSDLVRHIRIHTNERPFKCKLCPKTFSVSSSLAVHMRSHHAGLKCYLCDICDKAYATSSSLKLHKKTHLGEEYKSTEAVVDERLGSTANEGITLANVPVLTSENGEIEIIPLPVNVSNDNANQVIQNCSSKDKSQRLFDGIKITENNEEKPFKCTECKSSFKRLVHLKMHFRKHIGDKPFKCTTCTKGFGKKSILKKHLSTHRNKIVNFKPEESNKEFLIENSLRPETETNDIFFCTYVCPVCKHEFRSYTSCYKHLQKHNLENEDKHLKPIQITRDMNDTFEDSVSSIHSDTNNISSATTAATLPPSLPASTTTSTTTTATQLHDIINSLSHGQQLAISQNEEGVFSITTIDPEHQSNSIPDQSEVVQVDQAAVFTDKHNSHLFQPLQKTTLYDQNFDGCLFIQNDNLEINGQIIDTTNLATILQQAAGETHTCETCTLEFQTVEELNIHKTVHLTQKNEETNLCVICQKLFSSNHEYEQHIKSHFEKYINSCEMCSLTFSTEDELKMHLYQAHFKDDSPEKIKDTQLQSKNIIIIPSKEPSKVAVKGKKKTILLNRNVQHLSTTLLESILRSDKKKEVKVVHNNKCTFCPKSFRKPSDLVRHLRIHTGERPYECPKCNKTFNVKSTADCHMKTHTKDRSYKCSICTKTFSTSGSLRVHFRLHTGVKPYQCPLCDAKFRTSGHKLAHIRSHVKQLTQKSTKKISMPLMANDVADIVDDPSGTTVVSAEDINQESGIVNHTHIENSVVVEDEDDHDPTTEFLNTIQLNSAAKANKNETNDCLLTEFEPEKLVTTQDASRFIIHAVTNENGIEPTTYVVALEQTPMENNKVLEDIGYLDKKSNEHGTVLVTAPLLADTTNTVQTNCAVNNKYVCTMCKEHFQTQIALNKHIQKVHEEELYQCLVCPEKFTSKSDLEVHTVVHSLDPEWTCHSCSETFTDEEQLRCHKCIVHDGDTVVKTSALEPPSFDLNTIVTDFFLFSTE